MSTSVGQWINGINVAMTYQCYSCLVSVLKFVLWNKENLLQLIAKATCIRINEVNFSCRPTNGIGA
jgi:hypothetical protein